MLDIYKDLAENVLAMPVITGPKSDKEKFAGARATYGMAHDAGRQEPAGRLQPQLRHQFRRGLRHPVPQQGGQARVCAGRPAGACPPG